MATRAAKAGAALLLIALGIFLVAWPIIIIGGAAYFLGKFLYEQHQAQKGLQKFEGKWLQKEEIETILKERDIAKKERDERIQKLFSEGYNAVCENCEYAYHKKSSISIRCPNCKSINVRNG